MQSPAQLEAYLNEYKGNLFEFLVAQKVAQEYQLEEIFFQSMPPEYLKKLQLYQNELLKMDRELYQKLPAFADETIKVLLPILKDDQISQVQLVGKISQNKNSEHDLLLTGKKTYPLSLKFCKVDSFVNTKNAGFKSFLTQYFSFFNPENDQRELNQFLETDFSVMMHKLFESVGLNYLGKMDDWIAAGYSELPGELEAPQRQILAQYYYRLSSKLYSVLETYYQTNATEFFKALGPLLGYSSPELIHVMCFHQNYASQKVRAQSWLKYLESTDGWKLSEHKPDVGNFEIDLIASRLQLRIKPMNKFTTPAVKINCSVKYL